MTPAARCQELLERGRAYHALYGNGLANHLPMGLIALEKMGATPDQLTQFYHSYHTRLMPFENTLGSTRIDPIATRGQGQQFSNHAQYFEAQLEECGLDGVLTQYLPALLPGLSASAFHALIRLAYAIDMQDVHEVAYALAYWSSAYQALGALSPPLDKTLQDILHAMAPIGRKQSVEPGLIIDRMVTISQLEAYQDAVFQPTQITLAQLAQLAITAYVGSYDFTLLHGVTSCHAMRIILPWIADPESALRYFWQAFVVAYLSTGSVPIESSTRDCAFTDFLDIIPRACCFTDVHDIKLVYTCWAEYRQYGVQKYVEAANHIIEKNLAHETSP